MYTAILYVFMTDIYYQGSIFITDEYWHVICIHD